MILLKGTDSLYTIFHSLATRRNVTYTVFTICRRSGRFLIDKDDVLGYNEENSHQGDENMEITVNTTMGEMLEYDMGIAYVLMQCGMHCVGCPSSIGESLEEACAVHGLNPEDVLAQINAYLSSRDA